MNYLLNKVISLVVIILVGLFLSKGLIIIEEIDCLSGNFYFFQGAIIDY